MRRVAHDRICKLHEHSVSLDGQLHGMVIELLESGTLEQRIRDDGRMREFEVIQMAFDILAALTCMHEQKVIHRDSKPPSFFCGLHAMLTNAL